MGVLYEVSSVRASNWHFDTHGTIYSNRYDDSDGFHRTRTRAEWQVESRRVKGAGWRITEWPCLVTGNTRGSVALVQINTGHPFAGWQLNYGQGVSLGAIAGIWSEEARKWRRRTIRGFNYPAYSHVFFNTPNLECGCGKYRSSRYERIICERCGVEISRAPTDRGNWGDPPGVMQLTAPCQSWRSEPVGAGSPLDWRRVGTRKIDLEPVYGHVGKLITHLSV